MLPSPLPLPLPPLLLHFQPHGRAPVRPSPPTHFRCSLSRSSQFLLGAVEPHTTTTLSPSLSLFLSLAPRPPTNSWLPYSNLVGTLAEKIGAWVDMVTFSVFQNQLSGSVPTSAVDWKALTYLDLGGNQLSNALPALQFSQMTDCYLISHTEDGSVGSNAFLCPWPRGVMEICKKWEGSVYVAIKVSDCIATNGCSGYSTKLPAAQCAAWIKFYDGTNGDGWTGDAASCKRNDPCACKGYIGKHPVCNSDGTTVVNMCVRTRLPALPPAAAACCARPPLLLLPLPPPPLLLHLLWPRHHQT